MSEQSITFEKFFPRPLAFADKAHELEMLSKWNDAKITWETSLESATAEANKRINALESEVAELKDAKQDLEKEVIHLQEMNEPLQANNHDLRDALESLYKYFIDEECTHNKKQFESARTVLSASPAESLQAHDDEVIEKCAKAVQERGWTHIADNVIRALKGK